MFRSPCSESGHASLSVSLTLCKAIVGTLRRRNETSPYVHMRAQLLWLRVGGSSGRQEEEGLMCGCRRSLPRPLHLGQTSFYSMSTFRFLLNGCLRGSDRIEQVDVSGKEPTARLENDLVRPLADQP